MRVVFRTDSSLEIGTGHVMRCLTLAAALLERGAHCSFVCRELKGNLIDLIEQRGFSVASLPSPASEEIDFGTDTPFHAHWLGVDWQTDASQTYDAIDKTPVDWIVVDHYALDARWEKLLRVSCKNILVIDDLADRTHDCDLLLDQNLGRNLEDYSNLIQSDPRFLIGPKYALLRPEFVNSRVTSLLRRKDPRFNRVLITLGGVDQHNISMKILDVLAGCNLPSLTEVSVILGSTAPWIEQVKARALEMVIPTEVLVSVNNMAEQMIRADLIIGGGGATTWERCALGVPTITINLASNQNAVAQAMVCVGATAVVENGHDFEEKLKRTIEGLTFKEMVRYSEVSSSICDGGGTHRILHQMYERT